MTETTLDILSEIQTKLIAPKNQYNSFGKYNYRNVEDILEALKTHLAEHNSAITLDDKIEAVSDRIYIKATATLHTPHGIIANTAYAREPSERKGIDLAQISGATSSYARKYALGGLFACDDNRDPDSAKSQKPLSEEAIGQMKERLQKLEADEAKFLQYLKVSEFTELTQDDMPKIEQALKAKERQG